MGLVRPPASALLLPAARVLLLDRPRRAERRAEHAAQALVKGPLTAAGDGYWVHPASFDSLLQLGQVFILGEGQSSRQVYVPSGVEALHLSSQLEAPPAWAIAQPRPAQPGSKTVSSDSFLWSSEGPHVVTVSGLGGKAMQGGKPAAAALGQSKGAEHATGLQGPNPLYEVVWAADRGSLGASLSREREESPAGLGMVHASERLIEAAISVVQRLASDSTSSASGSISLSTRTLGGGPRAFAGRANSGFSQGASLQALMLTTRQEIPTSSLAVQFLDSFSVESSPRAHICIGGVLSGSLSGPDDEVYGSSENGKVVYRPQLLQSSTLPASGSFHIVAQPRGSLKNLVPVPITSGPLAPGQIELQVGEFIPDQINFLGF